MEDSYGRTERFGIKKVIMIMDDDKERLDLMHSWLKTSCPYDEFVLFDNAPDTIEWLRHNLSNLFLMSLDHDLGPARERNGEAFDPGTGRDVVNYLVTQKPACPVIVHSTNYIARDGMIFALEGAGWQASYVIPYNDLEWIEVGWAEEVQKRLKENPCKEVKIVVNQSKIYHIRDNLAVCGFEGIFDRQSFERHGFAAHLQCVEGFEGWLKECVEVKSLLFDDCLPIPINILDEAQAWLSWHWDRGHKILISCAAGESRSVTIAACLLTLKTETGFLRACEEVFNKVPGAYPHPNTLVSAAIYCSSVLTFDQLKALYLHIPVQPPFPWSDDIFVDSLKS